MAKTLIPGLAGQPRFTREERQAFARRRVALPVAIFVSLTTLYVCLVFLTLAAPAPLALALTVPCGVVIGLLFIVGHDACHNSFTASTRLNQTIGRLAFLPALHSFSLWDLAHNRTHHRYNNVRGWDYVWEPMTADEYRHCGHLRRTMYRFYRTPAGVAFYYLIEIWAPRLILARPAIVRRMTNATMLDTALVLLFLVLQVWAVITVGGMLGRGPLASLLFGLVAPFLVWIGLISFVIFLHHTHPAVHWYPSVAAWEADQGAICGTVHVRFPWPFGPMVLAIMEHNAHHSAPRVPLYNLPRMQRAMGGSADFVAWRFSWRAYFRVCQRCKLYDYDAGHWVSFDAGKSRPDADRRSDAAPASDVTRTSTDIP